MTGRARTAAALLLMVDLALGPASAQPGDGTPDGADAAGVPPVAAASPDLGWLDREVLSAGKVQVETVRSERPQTVAVKLAVLVAAPPPAIFTVLKACSVSPEYVPNVESCRSLEVLDGGAAELFVQVVKPIFFLPTFEHVFRLDYLPHERIDVRRVSGPLEHMTGTWWLLPQQDGTTLTVYEIELDPGGLVPRFLVRATLRRDLPKVVGAVRERAERAPD